MVGPGTGLAPLRSILQERAHQRARQEGEPASRDILFFGCRTSQDDFLYQEELEGYAAGRDLHKLCVAFSRDKASKVYVQDLIRSEAEAVWDALQVRGPTLQVRGL